MTEAQAYTIAQILETHPQCEVAWVQPGADCGQPGCTCRALHSVNYRVIHAEGVYSVNSFAQVRSVLRDLDAAIGVLF